MKEINLTTYLDEAKKHFNGDGQRMFRNWMEDLMLKKYRNVVESHPNPKIYVGIAEVLERVANAEFASQFLTGQLGRRYASLADYLSAVERSALDDVTKKFPELGFEIREVYRII